MRILILTPTVFPSISGNAATAERWRQELSGEGIAVRVMASDGLDAEILWAQWRHFRPDLMHVHHARKAGALLLHPPPDVERHLFVVSPGGTDINEDLANPARRGMVLQVLESACRIIVQNPSLVQHFRQHLPSLADKVAHVPKAVCWFGDAAYDLRQAAGCGPQHILFLLPSGIRPVKGNLECVRLMERVHELEPRVRLVVAGPPVDAAYAAHFDRAMAARAHFARWIREIPAGSMRAAYEASDIVLNTSLSEGLSNSLMEAIAAGRPVLASDIPGNRWPVLGSSGEAPAGVLFDPDNPRDFVEKALTLIQDRVRRGGRALPVLPRRSGWPEPADEARGLVAVYRDTLAMRP